MSNMKQKDIEQIKAFDRYNTQDLGVLNKCVLDGKLELSEVRVMLEIYLNR